MKKSKETAVFRIKQFLKQRSSMRGIDKAIIYTVHSNKNKAPAKLRTADLQKLISDHVALIEALKEAKADMEWVQIHGPDTAYDELDNIQEENIEKINAVLEELSR